MDADADSEYEYSDGSLEATQSEVEESVRRLNDTSNLTPKQLKMIQYVKDVYASGARIWTKESLRSIESDLAKDPCPEEIMVRSSKSSRLTPPSPFLCLASSGGHSDNRSYKSRLGFTPKPPSTRRTIKRASITAPGTQHLVYGELWNFITDSEIRRTSVNFNTYQDLLNLAKNISSGDQDEEEFKEHEPLPEKDQIRVTRALNLGESRQSYYIDNISEYSVLKCIWDETWGNWTKSKVCKELADTIAGMAHVTPTIDKVVCFGLGTFSKLPRPGSGGEEDKSEADGLPLRRPMIQHAAALTMATEFGKRVGKGPLKVFTQDPAYTDTEKQVLRDAGIEVLGGIGSLGFTYVDDDTLVFSISPNIPVRQVVADIARPAAMVWCTVQPAGVGTPKWRAEEFDGKWYCVDPWTTDPDSPRTRELVDGYAVYKFPHDEERFSDPTIYVRSD
ncbi:unnamed protein product [Clonostachys rosea]|uniref:SRR1-like domain-containing protein n=1 Tax=Bionectria ochroleuca TaxID=29856 RepID=A0ABY6U772_BIOOC|nr:unnamed protein product [Clonostachys rosea]